MSELPDDNDEIYGLVEDEDEDDEEVYGLVDDEDDEQPPSEGTP